ncbi:hypothetical protein BC831DRAFT_69212 [Entophlyctis helioformis]|nr:hypothetical protein BC831DRAFT_69212 [Entophlyctis helioformis]
MPAQLAEPVLTLAIGNLAKLSTIDEDDISTIWNVFTKCKDNLENGRRLENISWRCVCLSVCGSAWLSACPSCPTLPLPAPHHQPPISTRRPACEWGARPAQPWPAAHQAAISRHRTLKNNVRAC